MRAIVFIGLLSLAAGMMAGCDKEIKEAARPASLDRTPLDHSSPDRSNT